LLIAESVVEEHKPKP